MKYSEYEKEIIKLHYPNGGTKKVKQYIDRSADSIRRVASELKIKTNCRENNANISDFLNIKTEKISYLLGLIWGDGTVKSSPREGRISVTIKSEDAIDIKHAFDQRWKIHHKKPQKLNWKPQTTFYFNHKKLAHFLEKNDFCKKSLETPDKILSLIPKNLHNHFFRGWFDADGHISNTLTICGSYTQKWDSLIKLSNYLNITYNIYKYKNLNTKFSRFEILRKKNQKIFLDYIYTGIPIVKLQRKFCKYQLLNIKDCNSLKKIA
jgi:hypothetical protein